MSYLNETRYHWFSLDSQADLATVDLELSLDQTVWVVAEHTTAPLLADLPDPAPGFTRFWWRALFGPAQTLRLTSTEETVYGRLTAPDAEVLHPTWVVRSELPAEAFPCDWPVDYACNTDGTLPEPLNGMDATRVQRFERMAIDFLWNWTGRRFSTCEVTLRPCREQCWQGVSTFEGIGGALTRRPFGAVPLLGRVFFIGCGTCGDLCSCGLTPTLKLPGPVDSITQITVDGTVLPTSAYRVDNHNLLTRVDGDRWPTCQNMAATLGDPDTWGITYDLGVPVPVGGQIAAGVLTVELAKAACGDTSCALPKRLQTITRQGVTVGFMDAFDDLKAGGTGIWLVDSWITSVTKAPQRSTVRSPDVPRDRFRRTTWTG